MAKFLISTDVEGGSSPHIKKILKGKNVRIASAFLGKGAEDEVEAGSRLICDISMGGTNPVTLKELVKKLGENNLRYISYLHAKFYLSSRGCLVGSANLSNNGVGFLSHAKLIEASVLVGPNDQVAKSASDCFERLWTDAQAVGPKEIEWAEATWKSSKRGAPESRCTYDSFDHALADKKNDIWKECKFIITREQHSKSEKVALDIGEKKLVQNAGWESEGELDSFIGLSKRKKLDGFYISLHRGPLGGLYLNALKFIANINLIDENSNKIKASYFEIIPWTNTNLPSMPSENLKKNSALSRAISASQDKDLFGCALSAERFLGFIKDKV